MIVLGAGGILGEAWTSALLAGAMDDDSFDARECELYVGTSAGSIVAAMLCAGIDPRSRLGDLPEPPAVAESEKPREAPASWALRQGASLVNAVTGPLASLTLHTSVPGGRLLRREALRRVRRGERSLAHLGSEVERSGVDWDGRLAITTVELESGGRVVMDGSVPNVSVADAVQASCAIPGVFRPLVVDGSSYVDGGAWSPTNIDVAPVSKGTEILCLNPTAIGSRRLGPMALIGPWSRSVAAIEAAAARRKGGRVRLVAPDRGSVEAIGPNLMNPRNRDAVIAAGLAQGRRL